MKQRIFIAINLPKEIKKKLVNYQAKWPELPIKWIKKDNLHITLVFLGNISDKEIPEILNITQEIAQKHNPFSISLNEICYAPPKKMPPRMIWAKGEKLEELTKLYRDLESALFTSPFEGMLKPDNRPYSLHITLGRIHQWEFKQIEPEERPEVSENISLSFPVNSIEIMESRLKRTGAEYAILNSYRLKSEG